MSVDFRPYGFQPVRRRLGGAKPTDIVRRGIIASGYGTSIGIGDPIKMLTDGTFALCAAGEGISAVFAGWSSEDGGVWHSGGNWVGGTTWTIPPWFRFWDIETNLFKVQCDGTLPLSSTGDCLDHVAGTINTRSGRSGAYLGLASIAGAAASAQWKVDDLFLQQGNAWGDTYTEVIVFANEINLGRTPGNAI